MIAWLALVLAAVALLLIGAGICALVWIAHRPAVALGAVAAAVSPKAPGAHANPFMGLVTDEPDLSVRYPAPPAPSPEEAPTAVIPAAGYLQQLHDGKW